MVLAPLNLFPIFSASKALFISIQSKPLCSIKRLSSEAITAITIFGDIISRGIHFLCVLKVSSPTFSIERIAIRGVYHTGTHLRIRIQKNEVATKSRGRYKNRIFKHFKILVLSILRFLLDVVPLLFFIIGGKTIIFDKYKKL